MATPHAYAHLNVSVPQHVAAAKPNQPSLFSSPDAAEVEEAGEQD
jgi:hypothetical protein